VDLLKIPRHLNFESLNVLLIVWNMKKRIDGSVCGLVRVILTVGFSRTIQIQIQKLINYTIGGVSWPWLS
jgi:hypothetical protein